MHITTKQFSLTPQTYFKLLIASFFKKRWWLLLIMASFAALDLLLNDFVPGFATYFALIYPILILIRFWSHARSPLNRNLYIPKKLTITDEGIHITSEGENPSFLRKPMIVRLNEAGDFFMLYVSKTSFLGIPKSAFESPEDVALFRTAYKELL